MKKLIVLLALSLTACSTLNVQKDQVSNVKKVAIVGFGVTQEMPANLADVFKPKEVSTLENMKVKGISTDSRIDKMYDELAVKLTKEMNWMVLDRQVVATNPHYNKEFISETEGWQNRPLMGSQFDNFAATNIMDQWSFQRLDETRRRELIKKLGVDALVVVNMNIELEKGGGLMKLVGAVDYYPKARLMFQVYSTSSDKPIWQDTWAVGEATKTSVSNVMGVTTDRQRLDSLMIAAANDAYDKVFVRYRK